MATMTKRRGERLQPYLLSAPALVIVVERRQVVVNQRERVHELDRRGSRQHLLRGGACRLSDGEGDHGADAPKKCLRINFCSASGGALFPP